MREEGLGNGDWGVDGGNSMERCAEGAEYERRNGTQQKSEDVEKRE